VVDTFLAGTASARSPLASLLLYRRAIRKGTVGTLSQDEMDRVLDLEVEPA
jgi:hypothetical protein